MWVDFKFPNSNFYEMEESTSLLSLIKFPSSVEIIFSSYATQDLCSSSNDHKSF